MFKRPSVSFFNTFVCLLLLPEKLEGSLLNDLFANYDNRLRPAKNNNTIEVTIDMQMRQLLRMDEKEQMVVILCWAYEEWIDENLNWDPSSYDGMQQVIVPHEMVWQPDTYLYSNLEMDRANSEGRQAAVLIKVANRNATKVRLAYPAIYKSSCSVDIQNFPFDKQICEFNFGSWVATASSIYYKSSNASGLKSYLKHQEWKVSSFTPQMHYDFDILSNESFTFVRYKLIMQRDPLYYIVNMIVPALLITELCSLGFFTRSSSTGERSEKITLGLTAILSLSLFLLLISDQMPRSSLTVPLIDWYFLGLILLLAVELIASSLIVHLQHRDESDQKMVGIWAKLFNLFWKRKNHKTSGQQKSSVTSKLNSNAIEVEDFEYKPKMEQMGDENFNAQNFTKILKNMSVDLKNLRECFRENFEINNKETFSEWENLANSLETFFLIFFLMSNALLTVVFIDLGYSKLEA